MLKKKYTCVKVDQQKDGITWVIFNRPEKRNAMSPTFHAEMMEILTLLESDKDTKLVILTGEGVSYSAGQDLKEFFHVVPGGRIPPALERVILDYRESTFELGKKLVDWLQSYTPQDVTAGLSEPFTEMLSSKASLLRLLHYPPLSGSEEPGAERAAAHEDINLITILPVAEQPGLQVKDKEGNWVDVASVRGELVVNSGDMLLEATNEYFPSTTHRVINPTGDGDVENVSRISIPFFLTPRLEVVLSDRYTAGSYLEERLSLITS